MTLHTHFTVNICTVNIDYEPDLEWKSELGLNYNNEQKIISVQCVQ